jgi:hypothetical protein
MNLNISNTPQMSSANAAPQNPNRTVAWISPANISIVCIMALPYVQTGAIM